MPKPLLALAIALQAMELLNGFAMIPWTDSNAAQYQRIRRKFSTSYIEWKWYEYAQWRTEIMAACKNIDKDMCL